jgi:hypothetical protein
MAFEKLRTIVITAIPKPRARERLRKVAERFRFGEFGVGSINLSSGFQLLLSVAQTRYEVACLMPRAALKTL